MLLLFNFREEEKEENYDAESILKKAVKTSAKAVKVGSGANKGTPTKKIKKKKIVNLKQEQEFFRPNKTKLRDRLVNFF